MNTISPIALFGTVYFVLTVVTLFTCAGLVQFEKSKNLLNQRKIELTLNKIKSLNLDSKKEGGLTDNDVALLVIQENLNNMNLKITLEDNFVSRINIFVFRILKQIKVIKSNNINYKI